ncbi:MAG: hypothetical protein HKN19_14045 [Halioglobus sp.]|nr:hypothetical protein [Halioglobus sp.]
MLSLSADISDQDVDLAVINGEGDGGVKFGAELTAFAGALASRDETALTTAREELAQVAGPEVLVDAAAVAANFQRMVRIADATGIPADDLVQAISGDIADQLDLRRFHSAQNTPGQSLWQRCKNVPLGLLAKFILRAGDRRARQARE